MVFSSTIFLFCFLPLALLLVYALPQRYKNGGLLFMSLLFYSWGEPKYILVMLASILINFYLGKKVSKGNKKTYLAIAIVANLAILIFFKYAVFFADNINLILDQPVIYVGDVYLPIGISFFTFQAMSYIIDVYRGETSPQNNLIDLALYISLFPQLIAGPIVRYHDINEQLKDREINIGKFSSGVERFLIGLVKKVLLANNFAFIADTVFGYDTPRLDTPLAWVGILAYTLQIYFDFSAYSDMAIGLGRMLGFNILENFNYPYISKSIREFWRRWHISLSSWFRDYLYIPLGGNRVTKGRVYFNLLIVFLLTGLWHGASWNFIIWGLFHGFFLVIERALPKWKAPALLGHLYALLVVVVGWVFFRANTLPQAVDYLQTMFFLEVGSDFPNNIRFLVSKEVMWVTIVALLFAVPTRSVLLMKIEKLKSDKFIMFAKTSYRAALLMAFLISLSYLAADTYNPFIYFRF